jgi:hypothetical protein
MMTDHWWYQHGVQVIEDVQDVDDDGSTTL